MFVCDLGENIVNEGDVRPVDVHDGRTTCFEGDSHQDVTRKGGVDDGECVTMRYRVIGSVWRCRFRARFRPVFGSSAWAGWVGAGPMYRDQFGCPYHLFDP